MKITPVRKLKEFDGPKSHRGIILKIQDDARLNGVELPYDYIRNTVSLFFSHNGIAYYMRNFMSFMIPGLGRWYMNSAGYKVRYKRKKRAERLNKNSWARRTKIYNKKVKKLKRLNKKRKVSVRKRIPLE